MLKKQFLGAKIHIFEKRCSLRSNLVGTPCRTNTLCMYCQKATIANMAFSDYCPPASPTSKVLVQQPVLKHRRSIVKSVL